MLLFCNTAYMRYYGSSCADDIMENGGTYVDENNDGFETDNFHKFDEMCYGAVETKSKNIHGNKVRNQLHIERIAPAGRGKEILSGVTVVFCARPADSQHKTLIVGWYENATVYRYYQHILVRKNEIETSREYNISAEAKDCYLIPHKYRKLGLTIPRAKEDGLGYGFGSSQIWYADEWNPDKATQQDLFDFHNSVIEYLNKMKSVAKRIG